MRSTLLAGLFLAATALPAAADVLFESPHVHPLELSPDGSHLLAVNTDDHRLSIFALDTHGVPQLVGEVMVGLEPVSVRARTEREAWVVNHISDTISLVDLESRLVTRTLAVGDEPTDVVFAGGKAFVAVSQEDKVKIYDAVRPGAPLAELFLEGSDPRSLAVHGNAVYVTESLKGLTGTEPLHWRGDRENLTAFNGAFVSLMGRAEELSGADFARLEAFVMSVAYPPNANRELDGSLPDPPAGPNPTNGEVLFRSGNLEVGRQCVSCHVPPTGENGRAAKGVAMRRGAGISWTQPAAPWRAGSISTGSAPRWAR